MSWSVGIGSYSRQSNGRNGRVLRSGDCSSWASRNRIDDRSGGGHKSGSGSDRLNDSGSRRFNIHLIHHDAEVVHY